MIYLSGVVVKGFRPSQVGIFNGPNAYGRGLVESFPFRAYDNGCFSDAWREAPWLRWLDRMPSGIFAVAPDVARQPDGTLGGDWRRTLDNWHRYAPEIAARGFTPAYAVQDGHPPDLVPAADAIFLAGSTNYKLSSELAFIAMQAKHRGAWVHMGRANSLRRLRRAGEMHCDSADGTFLRFAPRINVPRLLAMLEGLGEQQLALA